MNIEKRTKGAFAVIGKEGSTADGEGFVPRLWADANAHYGEVSALAKTNPDGTLVGFWGLMSDFSRSFRPWEDNFSKGLYLAGVETDDRAQAPPGWTKWTVPAYEYLSVKVEGAMPQTFAVGLKYMEENHIPLAGAVHEYMDPNDHMQMYLFLPIGKP